MTGVDIGAIRRDMWYRPLWDATGNIDVVVAAGWFEEQLDADGRRAVGEVANIITPWHKLDFRDGVGNAVLITTGAFDPLHDGHVDIIEQAATHLRGCGYHITGGYLAVDHDHYVATKHADAANSHLRVNAAQQQLSDHQYLMVDPWPATWAPTALNFTTIIDRTRRYLHHHLNERFHDLETSGGTVHYFYVYGSDNNNFHRAFEAAPDWSKAVCVTRGNIEATAGPNVHTVTGRHVTSSTQLRHTGTPTPTPKPAQGVYMLRDDLTESLEQHTIEEAAVDAFRNELVRALDDAVGGRELVVVTPTEQQQLLNDVVDGRLVVSLDTWVAGDVQLGVSRTFHVADGQHVAGPVTERPDIERVFDAVSVGAGSRFVIVDDDICTGATVTHAANIIGQHPEQAISLGQLSAGAGTTISDIVDARDFCVIAAAGGLVVDVDGDICRVPYLHPAVSLLTRATLHSAHIDTFRQRLVDANVSLLTGSGLVVGDLEPAQRRWWHLCGYTDSTPAVEVCASMRPR